MANRVNSSVYQGLQRGYKGLWWALELLIVKEMGDERGEGYDGVKDDKGGEGSEGSGLRS